MTRRLAWRVVLLAACVACLAGPAVAHQLVSFGERPTTAAAGETATLPVEFHRADTATVTVGDGLVTIDIRDDDDGTVRIDVDLARLAAGSDAVTVESGALRGVEITTDRLAPGNYTLTAEPSTGAGDETRLIVTESTRTPTGAGDETATRSKSQTATPSGDQEPSRSGTAADGGESRPSVTVLLAALFGPLVPVATLAVVARVVS